MSRDQIGDALAEPIPDLVAPIVGWRAWKWWPNSDGVPDELRSHIKLTLWRPGEPLKADCVVTYDAWAAIAYGGGVIPPPPPSGHEAPSTPGEHDSYGCGIYAYSTPEVAYQNLANDLRGARFVMGEVQMWGRVWPHEHGWRSEWAYPKSIAVTSADVFGMRALARRYDVPLIDFPLDADTCKALLEARKKEEEAK